MDGKRLDGLVEFVVILAHRCLGGVCYGYPGVCLRDGVHGSWACLSWPGGAASMSGRMSRLYPPLRGNREEMVKRVGCERLGVR